jgi:hypothetical protein
MFELCFVWGPPGSGQKRWMSHASEETSADVKTLILALEPSDADLSVEEHLRRLEPLLAQPESLNSKVHIYCELPWAIVDEGDLLEDWIAGRNEFKYSPLKSGEAIWNLSFVGLCPWNAQLLPEEFRSGLEEFSRSSRSAVIVPSLEGNHDLPPWLGSSSPDFGNTVEVFDEPLWPAISLGHPCAWTQPKTKGSLKTYSFSVLANGLYLQELVRDLGTGHFGQIWSAEATWKNSGGILEAVSANGLGVFQWRSSHPSLVDKCPINGAVLSVVADDLDVAGVRNSLRVPQFS